MKASGRDLQKVSPDEYLSYSVSEDIYSRTEKEDNTDTEDIYMFKDPNEKKALNNEKDLNEDMSGNNIDVPGSALDDSEENIDDEENNYYILGGES